MYIKPTSFQYIFIRFTHHTEFGRVSVIIGDSRELICILWADDLILLSKAEEDLAKVLSKLSSYSKHNSLETNYALKRNV